VTEHLAVDELLIAAGHTGGGHPRVRDPGALAAAAARPQTTMFGLDAYLTLQAKAAALLHSIVRNDPMVDGNKGLGWLATVAFLEINGYELRIADPSTAEDFVVAVADGRIDVDAAAVFIEEHWRPLLVRPRG